MGAANKLYNGNIAETFWSTATDGGFVRNYGYKYDNLNRLKDATYQKSGQLTGMYNENLSYDKNGNIMNLSRYGDRDEQYLPIQIDNLQYGYATNSNKLMSVVDNSNNTSGFKDGITTGDDYVYDANGNMTVDKNKNITAITYNHLNLPTKIIFPTGNIVYFYTASGQKVQKVVTENTTVTTTDYLGGYQYQNTVLQFFPTAEGYVKNTPVSGTNTYSYVYNYTDHLGNVRLSYTKDTATGSLKILEENNYYPFGLKHNNYNVDNFQPGYKYKYNGKELQDELGLNTYAYGWREYDPAIGRFNRLDRFSEKYYDRTPYNYAANNPILYMDVKGDSIKTSFRTGFLGIFGKKVTLKYDDVNKKWTNTNGSNYTGKVSKFAKSAANDLNKNQELKEGNSLVKNLSNDNLQHYIVKGDPNNNKTTDNNIYYNGDTTQSGGMFENSSGQIKAPGFVVLGHEMAHKFSKNMGVVNRLWIGSSTSDPNARGVDETNAMHYENLLRTHYSLPRRISYDVDNTGQIYEPSRFLSGQNLQQENYPSNLNIITAPLY